MLTKTKMTFYGFLAAVLLAPTASFAQFGRGLDESEEAQLPGGTITEILQNIMLWITALIAIIGIIGFAIAGIIYLTAAGDEDRISMAKRAMIYSIVGVIVALLGFVILQAANTALIGEDPTI